MRKYVGSEVYVIQLSKREIVGSLHTCPHDPHPKKPRYKVTFPLRKVTFIFIDQSFALLTYDFQCFFVTLEPKYCIYFNYP